MYIKHGISYPFLKKGTRKNREKSFGFALGSSLLPSFPLPIPLPTIYSPEEQYRKNCNNNTDNNRSYLSQLKKSNTLNK